MELLHLWIEKYRNIKKQSYNFSSKYLFHIKETGKYAFEIDIAENEDHVENFFENERIKNITGIIGQNGSGKTSLLDFIKENLTNGSKGASSEFIMIINRETIDNTGTTVPGYSIFAPVHFHVTISQRTPKHLHSLFGIDYFSLESYPLLKTLPLNDLFENSYCIFYSNIFEGKHEISNEGLLNISTNYFVAEDLADSGYESHKDFRRPLNFHERELMRNMGFIAAKDKFEGLPFKLPEEIEIAFYREDRDIVLTNIENFDSGFTNELERVFKSRDSENSLTFRDSFYFYMFYNAIRQQFEFQSANSEAHARINEIFKEADQESIAYGIPEKITAFFDLTYRYPNTLLNFRATLFLPLIEVFERFLADKLIVPGDSNETAVLKVDHDEENFKLFLGIYMDSCGPTDFLNFKWKNLSSGQQSILTMLSRFHKISPSQTGSRDNLLILIDEGDVYFHPEWQRKLINILINFLPQVYSGKNIQLILTSNSPFIASDLPKQNLIFIDHNSNVLPKLNNREKTFASNIHSLLADGFFMSEGVMGEFAKRKIVKLIKRIEKGNDRDPAGLLKEIDVIGEPLLADRLKKMFDEKYGFQRDENIEARIQRLQLQLLEAEEIKRRQNEGR